MAVPARASQKSVRDAAGRAELSASPARGRGAWRRRQRRRSSSASATSWGGNGMRASAACAGARGSYCAKGVVAAAIKNVCLECARSVCFQPAKKESHVPGEECGQEKRRNYIAGSTRFATVGKQHDTRQQTSPMGLSRSRCCAWQGEGHRDLPTSTPAEAEPWFPSVSHTACPRAPEIAATTT